MSGLSDYLDCDASPGTPVAAEEIVQSTESVSKMDVTSVEEDAGTQSESTSGAVGGAVDPGENSKPEDYVSPSGRKYKRQVCEYAYFEPTIRN